MTIVAQELLDRPAAVHEFDGQPIEQLRMGRRLALDAEILDRADDAAAEQLGPQAIDVNPCRQGVVAVDQPAGQNQAGSSPRAAARGSSFGAARSACRAEPPRRGSGSRRGRTRLVLSRRRQFPHDQRTSPA